MIAHDLCSDSQVREAPALRTKAAGAARTVYEHDLQATGMVQYVRDKQKLAVL